MKNSKYLCIIGALVLFSCGPSKEEIALRERIVKDSLNHLMDSMKMAHENSKRFNRSGSGNSNSESNTKDNYLQKLDFTYRADNSPLNPKTDVECKLTNRNSVSLCCFEFSIKCYDEFGHILKSFSKSYNETLTPGAEDKFTLTYSKVKKCKSTKVEIVSAKSLK